MDSDRFDRWTKLFAQRMSRRTAAAAVGAATVASLTSPRWALGQDDDDDQNSDDQNTDDQDGDDTNGGGDGGDDTSDDQDGDSDDLGEPEDLCKPITRCKIYHCAPVSPDETANCTWLDVGPIPGDSYPQHMTLDIPPCKPDGDITLAQLAAKCNAAYPGKDCFKCCNRSDDGDNACVACADYAIGFCH